MRYDDKLTASRQTIVTHLECSETGEHYLPDVVHGLSSATHRNGKRRPPSPPASAFDRGLVSRSDRCKLFNCATA